MSPPCRGDHGTKGVRVGTPVGVIMVQGVRADTPVGVQRGEHVTVLRKFMGSQNPLVKN